MTSSPPLLTLFGGTGLVGRNIVQALAEHGYRMRVPTRDVIAAQDMKVLGDVGQINPFLARLSDNTAVAQALHGADCVVNLLGILNEKGKDNFQNIHVETAARIARTAKEEGVKRFIHVSAFGASLDSASVYANTKAAGEDAVRAFFPNATLLRPDLIFARSAGFFKQTEMLLKILPLYPLLGGGETRFSPVCVEDVARMVQILLTQNKGEGETFDLVGPETFSLRDLVAKTATLTNQKTRFISINWGLARSMAAFLSLLPGKPLLTQDQITQLQETERRPHPMARGFESLDIYPKKIC